MSRFISSVESIWSIQSSVSSFCSLASRLASSTISWAWRSASLTISVCDASRSGLLARLAEDPVALALRLGEHLLPLLDDPARLLDLLGNRGPHLVEDVVDLLAVDAHLVGQRDGLRVVHEVVELVDEYENVHWKVSVLPGADYSCGLMGAPGRPPGYSSANRAATLGGTNSVHVSAERGDLLHAARGDEAELRARHHVDGLDVGRERAVQVVHLELPLEVGDHAQPLHHRLRAPAAGEVDDELGEDVHLDVAVLVERVAEELDALLDGEHRPLVVRVADDADDDAVEDRRRRA